MKKPQKLKKPKKRNPIAKALPGYKPSVVPEKTTYKRKPKHPRVDDAVDQ